jgi:heme-degrading monooxygenase HmoA
MNYSALNKVRVSTGNLADYIENVSALLRRSRVKGLAEVAFYHSLTDPQELYVLTLWFGENELEETFRQLAAGHFPLLTKNITALSFATFRLIWEQRSLSYPVVGSTLHLLRWPPGQEKHDRFVNYMREMRWKLEGVVGGWVGSPTQDRTRILIRTDWGSVEAMQAYYYSPYYREEREFYRSRSVSVEQGSTHLHSLVYPARSDEADD